MLKGKTVPVLLVTHHLNYAKEADKVIVMKDGEVEAEGSFEELIARDSDFLQFFKKSQESHLAREEEKKNLGGSVRELSYYERKASSFMNEDAMLYEEKQTIQEEDSVLATGNTYKKYIKEGENYSLAFLALSFYIITQILILVFTKYIGY
jgi:ABC-type multidrug transport system ATPase subunit